MSNGRGNQLDRRTFAKAGALGLAALAAGINSSHAEDASPFGPFKMGFQTYSVRFFKTLDEVIAKAKELGVSYLEFYPGHLGATTDPKQIADVKKKLDDAKLTAMAYGVVYFGADIKENRKHFEFAKMMGIGTLSADFDPKSIISLDRLCEEFPEVRLGIHNHGPGARYQKPEDVIACVKDHHKNIGATADLGHYIRSKQDPLEVIEKLKDRLYGIHFKDYKFDEKGHEHETIAGEGTLKVKETLALLKKINFNSCIALEYESNEKNPVPDMQKALDNVKAAVKEL